jgi:hypothetical protein
MVVLFYLVVICDFDFVRIATLPTKADAILVVDPNAVLSTPVPAQTLKAVPGRQPVLERRGHD